MSRLVGYFPTFANPVPVVVDGVSIVGAGTVASPIAAVGASPSGYAALDGLRWSSFDSESAFTPGVTQNDYAPTNWATKTWFRLFAADNEGTRITGFAALATNGVRIVTNVPNAPVDDGNLVLMHQDSRSIPANRIFCPHGQPLMLSSGASALLIYDTVAVGWVVVATGGRGLYLTTQSLGIYPQANAPLITGTINTWAPTATKLQGTAFTGIGAAGGGLLWGDSSMWVVQTVDTNPATITGFAWSTYGLHGNAEPSNHGPVKYLVNFGPGLVTLKHHSIAEASGDWITCPGGVDYEMQVGDCVQIHNLEGPGWQVIGTANRQDGNYAGKNLVAGRLNLGGAAGDYITPTALPNSQTDNYIPTGFLGASRIRQTCGGASCIVTGMGGVLEGVKVGDVKTWQVFAASVTFKSQNIGSIASRQFLLPSDLTVPASGSATFVYDNLQLWQCIGCNK